MAETDRLRIEVLHDNPVLRAGLMALLASEPGLECVDGDSSTEQFPQDTRADVIVADFARALERARHASASRLAWQAPVVAVSDSERECDIRDAIAAGLQGYLLVDDVPRHLVVTVRTVRRDTRILSPKAASRLAGSIATEPLTPRELAVLRHVVEGLCNKAIATQLGITAGTVKSHLRSAFAKLGVASRAHAVALVHRRGLIQPPALR